MKTTLTIEESARLVELGVDAKLASKCWISSPNNREVKALANHDPFYYELLVNPEPVFTLTDILSILPKMIDGYHLNIDATTGSYDVAYVLWDDDENWEAVIRHFLCEASAPELIDALYQLLIGAIESNFFDSNTDKK